MKGTVEACYLTHRMWGWGYRMNAKARQLIVCGTLFDSCTGTVKNDIAILVEGDRVAEVAPFASFAGRTGAVEGEDGQNALSRVSDALDAVPIDLSHLFVMPGLIEGHAHIGMDPALSMDRMFLYGGFGEITVRSIRNAQADLLAGFTTVRDEASFSYTDVDVRNMIDRGEIWGPRLKVSGMALTSTGGHADVRYRPGMGAITFPEAYIAYVVNGADEARRAARNVIKYGVDVVKLMATGGVLSGDASVGAPDLAYDEMKAACDIAHAHGKIVSAHAHGAQGIKDAIRAGVTSIEHGTLIDEEGCELMVERGVYHIPTLIAHHTSVEKGARGEIPQLYYEKALQCEESAATGLTRLHELGAKVGFGTDAGTPGNPHGAQADEFRLVMEAGGFTAVEVLQAATVVNAQMLGMTGQVGSLAVGAYADIAAFDGDPLQDIRAMGRCSFVMKGGTVYKRDGAAQVPQGV